MNEVIRSVALRMEVQNLLATAAPGATDAAVQQRMYALADALCYELADEICRTAERLGDVNLSVFAAQRTHEFFTTVILRFVALAINERLAVDVKRAH